MSPRIVNVNKRETLPLIKRGRAFINAPLSLYALTINKLGERLPCGPK